MSVVCAAAEGHVGAHGHTAVGAELMFMVCVATESYKDVHGLCFFLKPG